MWAMSSPEPKRTTGSTLAAWLIIAAILGFAGGGFIGVQTGGDANAEPQARPTTGTQPNEGDGGAEPEPTNAPETSDPAASISFDASSLEVTGADRVTFTGSLTPAEGGVELVLMRSVDGGEWTIFPSADNPVDPFVTKDDGSYERYVENLRTGDNTFKLVHSEDSTIESEPLTVVVE